jgi:hypothetical protein
LAIEGAVDGIKTAYEMNRERLVAQLLLRSLPFPRGSGLITDRFFSDLAFTEESAKVTTTDGFKITVMPNELIGRHIYLTGEFDRSTVEILCYLAKSGDTLLDVGANIGYVSACFLKNKFRPRAILFEDHSKKSAPSQQIGIILRSAHYEVFRLSFKKITCEADCLYSDYVALYSPPPAVPVPDFVCRSRTRAR